MLRADELNENISHILDGYNLLASGGDGAQKLKNVTDQYLSTFYTILCEFSIKHSNNTANDCIPLVGDSRKAAHDKVFRVMRKAHGHGYDEPVIAIVEENISSSNPAESGEDYEQVVEQDQTGIESGITGSGEIF
jgi:hypothetical protein